VSQPGVWEVDERVELQACAGGLDSTTEQRVPTSFPRTPAVPIVRQMTPTLKSTRPVSE
jgi:hypothetical protein